jgi:hypothetical protein
MSVHLGVIVYILVYPVFLALQRDKSQNSAPNDRTWQEAEKCRGGIREKVLLTLLQSDILLSFPMSPARRPVLRSTKKARGKNNISISFLFPM